jgi:hypothetical protein
MRIKLLAILFFFLILVPATAQDEAPLPILHAEDIFAEGVMEIELLPIVKIDNMTQQITEGQS